MKARSHGPLFLNVLTLAVICKQRLLYGNKIVQCLQSCKCYNFDKDHFRKLLINKVKSRLKCLKTGVKNDVRTTSQ